MKGYVFKAGAQTAISKDPKGGNLPPPKVGTWAFIKTVEDVTVPGLIGFDPQTFNDLGYQIWPA